jgi:DNA repair protein RadA/Sms
LGFSLALIPKANAPKAAIQGMQIVEIERVEQAVSWLREHF